MDDDLIFLIYAGLWILFTLIHCWLLTVESLLKTSISYEKEPSSAQENRRKSLWRIARSGLTITSLGWIANGISLLVFSGFPLSNSSGLIIALSILVIALLWFQDWWEHAIMTQQDSQGFIATVKMMARKSLFFLGTGLHKDRSEVSDHRTEEPLLNEKVLQFNQRMVREVMVPRVDMVCLFLENPFTDNLSVIRHHRHTQYLLCDRDKDHILGVIHIQDVYDHLLTKGSPPILSTFTQPEVVIPETMDIIQTLRTLEEKQAGIAVVVDEFGGTSGMVTLEDITREMFSDIQDKFDLSPRLFSEMEGGVSVHPRALITEVNEFFHININDPGNDTIGGWFFSQLEKVPEKGDAIFFGDWEFIVEKAHDRWIDRLLARPLSRESTIPLFTQTETLSKPLSTETYMDTSLS
ncbi:transporter associated domain-containing protein [Marininema mesophilum]|uniref:transporter associated domain-containing protein n=1 Tax=Marininema mesophilum TaxID=1048340 RepID=UPI001FDF900A|nr:transporter associated domain-containing protein [Marininema mesophilum]